jgi:5-methylthioribose kinase
MSVFVLDESTAVAYCKARGLIDASAEASACSLGGGVSNEVILVVSWAPVPDGTRLVLKQALGRLRVEADWFANRDRISIEAAALRAIGEWIPGGVPRVLDEDPANYIMAMECAPESALPWKTQLLAGAIDFDTAATAGALLAEIHLRSAQDPACREGFASIEVFDALRIDPYYRTIARVHPDLERRIAELIDGMSKRPAALVHGDYSPKNILVDDRRLMLIDCEVCHWGDPGFDTGFLLNHLLLKAQYRPQWAPGYLAAARSFWDAYSARDPGRKTLAGDGTTVEHLGPLMLARIDGKSPVEYIREEGLRERVRALARELILDSPATVAEVCERVSHAVAAQPVAGSETA